MKTQYSLFIKIIFIALALMIFVFMQFRDVKFVRMGSKFEVWSESIQQTEGCKFILWGVGGCKWANRFTYDNSKVEQLLKKNEYEDTKPCAFGKTHYIFEAIGLGYTDIIVSPIGKCKDIKFKYFIY